MIMKVSTFLLSVAAVALSGCSNELNDCLLEDGGGVLPNLSISVLNSNSNAKTLIEEDYLPNASEIGITVLNSSGGAYDGTGYQNIKFKANGTGPSQTWTGDETIYLSATQGYCYGYYPYSSSVSDISSVSVSTANQVDYMYAVATPVDIAKREATLNMKHALSAIRFALKRGSYTGTGTVSNVSVSSSGLGTTASLNAMTGKLSGVTGLGSVIGVNANLVINEVAKNIDVIVVPSGTSAAVTLSVDIDGKTYRTSVGATELAQGACYTYTLLVNAGELSLSGIKVGDWGYSSIGEPEIKAGSYTVTFAGNYTDIAFSNTVSDGMVTIRATSLSEGFTPLEVSSSGGTLTQRLSNDVLTITLADITSDVTLNFYGTGQLWPEEGIYALTSTGYPVPVAEATADSYAAIGFKVRGKKYQIAKKEVPGVLGGNSDYWNDYKSTDNPDFPYITTIDGNNSYGYFQQPDGSYAYSTNNISSSTSEWVSGALVDFSGAQRTDYLLGINELRAVPDPKWDETPSAYSIKNFRNDAAYNEGFSDWFIPSLGELAFIYTRWSDIKRLISKVDGFTEFSSDDYWSCSATSQTNTRYISFSNGYSGSKGIGGTEYGIFRLIRHL